MMSSPAFRLPLLSFVSGLLLTVPLAACGGGGDPIHGTGAASCGDGVVEGDEACDDANAADGDGCSASCTVEGTTDCATDASCPPPVGPVCGNGVLEAGEACDDGNTFTGDGCTHLCTVQQGYVCSGAACVFPQCGDKVIQGSEACDDGNDDDADGCTATCQVEVGWQCTGAFCGAVLCGDGKIAGNEECEDDDTTPTDGDGCSASCKLEKGWKCPTAGGGCDRTYCGDGVKEGTEACDDGDSDWGDGCTPECTREPSCSGGTCTPVCGDGVILPNDTTEKCDDGNTRANDGCSPTCQVEDGFECELKEDEAPPFIDIPVVYRDFRGKDLAGGHPDFQAYSGSGITAGIVGPLYSPLSADGKPVLADPKGQLTDAASFYDWYRDSARNATVRSTLRLNRQMSGAYQFSSNAFFPLDNKGWMELGQEAGRDNGHNYHFTSETRYWFQYKGTEILRFDGDDDVWVFINGRLAADVGGMHSVQSTGNFQLSQHAAANQLDLKLDGLYEAVVFQAERRTSGSNYTLTLTGFNAKRTRCEPRFVCGDGQVQPPLEQCDDGVNDGGYGECAPGCVLGPRCGDGVVQAASGETCDDGNTQDGDACPALCRASIN